MKEILTLGARPASALQTLKRFVLCIFAPILIIQCFLLARLSNLAFQDSFFFIQPAVYANDRIQLVDMISFPHHHVMALPSNNPYPKIVFAGVLRNMNKDGYLDYFFPKFLALAESITSEFHVILVENDSTDGTREYLQKQFSNHSSVTLVFLDDLVVPRDASLSPLSVEKVTVLSTVRNRAVEIAESKFSNYDYFAMVDMDGVCAGPDMSMSYDPDIFKYVLTELKDQWDVITFRFEPYYDLWAFRHAEYMPLNYWFPVQQSQASPPRNKVSEPKDMVPLFESVKWPDGLIEVQSSFEMFAIYRMALLNGTARYGPFDENNHTDCEHVAFHRALREKMNARLRMSPLIYCQGDPGYTPLPSSITARLPPNPPRQ